MTTVIIYNSKRTGVGVTSHIEYSGKSDIAHGVAATLNLKLIDIRLGQCDPTDLNGFPAKSADGKNSTYLPMDTFPLEGADIPTGFDGWLIMYDELPGASKAVQDAA